MYINRVTYKKISVVTVLICIISLGTSMHW